MEEFKKKKLPIYDLIISEFDDATEVNYLSLVESPAIEVNYVAFSKENTNKVKFKIQNAEKQMVCGPIAIPGLPIYRRNEDTGEEYYVQMSPKTIENAVKKFAKKGFNTHINANHSTNVPAYLMENWLIVDSKNDKSNSYGFSNLPVGTWMGVIFLENEAWQKYIKSGELSVGGVSLEGIFSTGEVIGSISMSSDDEFLSFIADILLDNKFEL